MTIRLIDWVAWPWYALLLVWLPGWFAHRRASSAPQLALQIPTSVLLAVLFRPDLVRLDVPVTPRTMAFGIVGPAFEIVGVAFAIWARIVLGRNWSGVIMAVQDEHQLIQSGPYAIVRHPIYTGLLVAILGTALTLGTLGGYLGFAAGLVALLIRVAVEDRLMRRHFGAAHDAYRQRTKCLIPFVW